MEASSGGVWLPHPSGPVWLEVWPPGPGAVASRPEVGLRFAAGELVPMLRYLLCVHSLGSGGASLGFP